MIHDVLRRIREACERAHRDPRGVQLVAVTKGRTVQEIHDAVLRHGRYPLGENRVQEALPKMAALQDAEFHLIGHLQRNKVKFARDFALIHSLDSTRLADELARHAERWGAVPPVLLEINAAREPQKHGLDPDDAASALRHARELNLHVRGLMTVAPQGDPGAARDAFKTLRALRDNLGLEELSMGMSDDFEAAIEEGATLVRIGRALFQPTGDPK